MDQPGDEDDRTVIRLRPVPKAQVPLGHTLALGTRLLDYEVTGLIGEGGFGIVYSAWDHSLQRKVAVKEYMPASMASRAAGSSAIVVKSDRHVDTFKAGLKSFVNEARLLARFDHPSLVKVYRFWEENGTAYMVMPFYEGPTLKTSLSELGRAPSEAELRAWLRPLLDALSVMHAAQCFHRDIAPDNILLTPTGPLLLDFGAARRVIGDMTHVLTVVLKPGYAPIEQYGDVATMAQGPWTDIYALACVVYYAITGKTPTSSVERLMDDRLEPLAVAVAGRYSDPFLRAIDAALAVRPQDRPQNDAQFRALLNAGRAADDSGAMPLAPAEPPPSPQSFPSTQQHLYSTVPGTLKPELATQLLAREPAPAAPAAAPPPVPPARTDDADFAKTRIESRAAPEPKTRIESRATPEPRTRIETRVAPEAPAQRVAGKTTAPAPPASAAPTVARTAPRVPAPTPGVSPTRHAAAKGKATAAGPSRRAAAIGSAAALVVVAAGTLAWWVSSSSPGAGAADPRSVDAAASAAASAADPVRTPAAVSPAAVAPIVPATADVASAAAASAPAATPTVPAAPTIVSPAPDGPPVEAAAAPASIAAPVRPRRPPPPPRSDGVVTPTRPPAYADPYPPRRAGGARCSDILQKASLEPLTAEEAAYLRRECR